MKRKIVVIDDEPRYLRVYVQELKSEFEPEDYEVKFCRNLDKAYALLKEEGDRVAVIILDIMMPNGKILEFEKTEEGLNSGMLFYHKIIREKLKLTNTPVIMLTNREKSDIAKDFEGEKQCFIAEKVRFLPFELCEKVKDILA